MQTFEKIPDFLFGGGEMGERIRNFDWSKTPLGTPHQWSQSLKTSVSICLNSNFPIAIYWGRELILIYNDAWSPIPGNKHPWALGKPANEVWADIWNELEPEFKKAFTGLPGGSKDALLPMQRHGYTEECYFDFTFTPVRGTEGSVEGIFNAVIETTYRVINERRNSFLNGLSLLLTSAQTKHEVFQKLLSFFSQNINHISFSFFYEEINGKAVFFASTNENKEPELKQHFPFDSIAEDKKILLIQSVNEYLHEIPEGSWEEKPVEAVILPVTDTNSNITHYIICGLNTRQRYNSDYDAFFQSLLNLLAKSLNSIASLEEERKRAEALAEIDKAKTLFFTNISHEFRTPLTLMLGPIEEALNDAKTRPENAKRMDVAHRNAMRLLKLVNTLLDFSRIESGKQKANFELTDIVAFTKNLASNFRSITEKAGLQLNIITKTFTEPVYIDREMWEKIVFNLLSNAFKYTLQGSITIKLTTENECAVLKIKDTGIGIPGNELPHMFERFHRVQNMPGRTFEGTGIGLSLTKELVHLHGGTIQVASRQGAGSVFTVAIPFGKEHLPAAQIKTSDTNFEHVISDLYAEEAATFIEDVAEKNKARSLNKALPVVMIVDDNADMRQHIETILSGRFNTVTANDGMDALKQSELVNPDIILSDIMMPVMDGIQLLKAIKNNKQTEQIPVILLTARAGEESKIEGWETGADDYLIKPFSAKELVARISAQITLKQKRDVALQNIYNLFNEVPFAVAVLKGNALIIDYANQYTLNIWQRKREEVLGKPMFEVVPESRESAEQVHLTVYKTGKRSVTNELPVIIYTNGKNETRYFNSIVDPLFDEQGEIIGQLATTIEVTEQVLARKKIEESEQELHELVKQAPVAIVLNEGKDLITRVANEMALNLMGKTETEILNKPMSEYFPEVPERKNIYLNVFKTQVPYIGKDVEITFNRFGKNYTGFYDLNYVPWYGNNGKIKGVMSVGIEVTQQVLARKKIEESEKQLSNLANAMPQLVWIADPGGEVIYYNERVSEFAGAVKNENGKWRWQGLIHPDDLAYTNEAWNNAVAGGTVYEIHHRIQMKNGAYRWYLSRGLPQKDEEGKIFKWYGTATDITEQKTFAEKLEKEVAQRTEELVKANKELESFNYIASHDLQEPLRKIQTFIGLIEKDKTDTVIAEKYFSKIKSAAQRMSELIQSILSYSRLSASGQQLLPTDLNKILCDVENDFELLIKEQQATIKSDKMPVIKASALQMHQLFSNLLSNSLKFSNNKPGINITSEIVTGDKVIANSNVNLKQKFVQLTFADNGIGFDTQFKDQIFHLFQRLHGRNEYEGTGIGLSIVKKIVDQHNGFITADSAPGKGATFTIWLPVE